MVCGTCGCNNEDAALYCANCGAPLKTDSYGTTVENKYNTQNSFYVQDGVGDINKTEELCVSNTQDDIAAENGAYPNDNMRQNNSSYQNIGENLNNNSGFPNNGGYQNANGVFQSNNSGYSSNVVSQNNGAYPNNNGVYPNNGVYQNAGGAYPNNNSGYPSNAAYPNKNNGGFPNNNGVYPNNGVYQNTNGAFPNNGGYPGNRAYQNNGAYPNNGYGVQGNYYAQNGVDDLDSLLGANKALSNRMKPSDYLKLPAMVGDKKKMTGTAISIYVLIVISAAFSFSQGNYWGILDYILLIILSVNIQLRGSLVAAYVLLGYGILNTIIYTIEMGFPAGFGYIIAGIFAVIATNKFRKSYKEYVRTGYIPNNMVF
ncbi:MAG: zinc ribbon domain-containing protein [Butyrivibrio sp.]|nr:zinc ribbon domain-containing protein [Butyrivibrio sp.]